MSSGYPFVGFLPLLRGGKAFLYHRAGSQSCSLRPSLPTDSCFNLSSSVSFPSSDSDSEGDNPEKKKLQEQLMGKKLEAPRQRE